MCCCWTSRRTIWIFRRWKFLEESLLEFRGALVLVTHDRYMLDRVSTTGARSGRTGNAERFADYSQWETLADEQKQEQTRSAKETKAVLTAAAPVAKKKLSYLDSRDMETIEERINEAEEQLADKRAAAGGYRGSDRSQTPASGAEANWRPRSAVDKSVRAVGRIGSEDQLNRVAASGCVQGSRYGRCSIRFASSSPVTCCFSASHSSVRPSCHGVVRQGCKRPSKCALVQYRHG